MKFFISCILILNVAAFGEGKVFLESNLSSVSGGSEFVISVLADTDSKALGSYEFTLAFDSTFCEYVSGIDGAEGFGTPLLNAQGNTVIIGAFNLSTGVTSARAELSKLTFKNTGSALSGAFSISVSAFATTTTESIAYAAPTPISISLVTPEITAASIVESTLKKGSTATLSVTQSTDPAPDAVLYQWMINGIAVTGETLATADLSTIATAVKGAVLTCVVTPQLSGKNYTTKTTAGVTIANTAPVGGIVSVTPLSPSPSDDIVAVATGATDIDSDSVSYTYTWSKNGVLISNQTATIKATETTKDDTYVVTATPTDGTDVGAALTQTVMVGNALPTIQKISLSSNVGMFSTNISIFVDAKDGDGDAITYLYDLNSDGVADQTLSANTLVYNFGKGTHQISVAVKDQSGQSSYLAHSETIVISNTAPQGVSAGPDRSAGSNILLKLPAQGNDPDVSDVLTYAWSQISGPDVSLANADKKVAEVTPSSAGSYMFAVTVSDNTVSVSDNITITIENLFAAPPTIRDIPTTEEVSSLASAAVSTDADVAQNMQSVFILGKKQLQPDQRLVVIQALENIFNSGASIVIDESQVTQALATFDNMIDGTVTSGSNVLSESEVLKVSSSIDNMLKRGLTLGVDQVAKTFEVINEVMAQYPPSGNAKLSTLTATAQKDLGTALISASTESYKQLTSGQTKEIDQVNLRMRAQAFDVLTTKATVGDNLQGYTITVPENFSLTPVTVSAVKMAVNPHAGKVAQGEKEPVGEVVSFNIKTLGTSNDHSFSNTKLTLTIPVPDASTLTGGNTFQPKYFDETLLTWSSNGISNVQLNSDLTTVTFDVDHLTDFSVTEDVPSQSVGGSGGSGGGGCLLK